MNSSVLAGAGDTPQVDISVVIPVYNSSACLPELLAQLDAVLNEHGRSYEIVLVEDSSPDDSWQVIQTLSASYKSLVAIRLMRNGGQARATLCGLEQARGRHIVVTMDDDLQQHPNQLPRLLREIEGNPDLDCVFGVFPRKQHAAYRNLGSRAIGWLNRRAFGLAKDVQSSSFRVMRSQLARAIVQYGTENPAISALLYSTTHRVTSVAVEHRQRFAGRSNYTLAKQMRLALDNIANVSMLPLRLVSSLGLVFCLLTAVYIAVMLWRYFTGHVSVPGWTTVIVLLSFFSGVILLSLGVLGEYLVRVLREVRRAPRYVIRETLGMKSQADSQLLLQAAKPSVQALHDPRVEKDSS